MYQSISDSRSNSLQKGTFLERQQMALAMSYNDNQWCTYLHCVLYFVFWCPLCNDWLKEFICLFASCVDWWQILLLVHILNVSAWLEPFANKMCHFDHQWRCLGLCVKCFEKCVVSVDNCTKATNKNCNSLVALQSCSMFVA